MSDNQSTKQPETKGKQKIDITKGELIESFKKIFLDLTVQKVQYERLCLSANMYSNYIKWYVNGCIDDFDMTDIINSSENKTKIRSTSGYTSGSKDDDKPRLNLYRLYKKLKQHGYVDLSDEALYQIAVKHKFPDEIKNKIKTRLDIKKLNTSARVVNASLPVHVGELNPFESPGIDYDSDDSNDSIDDIRHRDEEYSESEDELDIKYPEPDFKANGDIENRLDAIENHLGVIQGITEKLQIENENLKTIVNDLRSQHDILIEKMKKCDSRYDRLKAQIQKKIIPEMTSWVVSYIKKSYGR
jgi:hypothetical protein